MPLSDWYTVEFDAEEVRLSASPPGHQAWEQSFRWDTIERVCFEAAGFAVSDGLYIFTSLRPESYVIPIEAVGGQELWFEIIDRGLFDAELAIQAAASAETIFCWPPAD